MIMIRNRVWRNKPLEFLADMMNKPRYARLNGKTVDLHGSGGRMHGGTRAVNNSGDYYYGSEMVRKGRDTDTEEDVVRWVVLGLFPDGTKPQAPWAKKKAKG